ncbi:MAG: hypothetical protein LBS88_13305 [Tannerellaceae bacterium]|jgi:hypothetical protein|nr:hypothetical protein [Tannerellaceae bacterium]
MESGAFDYVDFQFKLSQIQWISIVLARYEAIQGAPVWIASPFRFAMTARNDDATI